MTFEARLSKERAEHGTSAAPAAACQRRNIFLDFALFSLYIPILFQSGRWEKCACQRSDARGQGSAPTEGWEAWLMEARIVPFLSKMTIFDDGRCRDGTFFGALFCLISRSYGHCDNGMKGYWFFNEIKGLSPVLTINDDF